jgi:hypothetical protein
MTYCALVRQANGVFFYCYNDGKWKLPLQGEVWQALRDVVAEVNANLPLFTAEHVWWPYDHDFRDRKEAFNAALESSITPARLRVVRGNRAIAPGDYVLAVNTTDRTHQYRFRLGKNSVGYVDVLAERRSRPIKQDWVEDEFAPFAVHVYGPLPPDGY